VFTSAIWVSGQGFWPRSVSRECSKKPAQLVQVTWPFDASKNLATFYRQQLATLISGDSNIHLDNPADTLTSQFLSLLSSSNLSQHVQCPLPYVRQKSHSWSGHNLFRHVTCSGRFLHPLVSIRPLSSLHQTVYKPSTTPSSNTSLFPTATLHRR